MRKLNWVAILLTALVTGVVTIGAGVILDRLRTREPRLVYSTLDTIPFTGENRVLAIYHVSIDNEGKRAVEDVACHIRIPWASIEESVVSADPAIPYDKSTEGDTLKLHFPGLNASEAAQVSVLATAASELPIRPVVSLRAKGVSGVKKSAEKEQVPFVYKYLSALTALIGVTTGLVFLQAIFRVAIRSKGEKRYGDDQRQVLAYVCGIHGLTAEVDRYLSQLPKASYWAEADRLAGVAIASNNPETTQQIKSALKDLLEYDVAIAKSSRGLICYNLARMAAAAGDSEEIREYLEQARSQAPALVDARVKLDPVFRGIEDAGQYAGNS